MDDHLTYDELIRRAREVALLSSCEAVLGWDELTHLPPGGAEDRSRQMAYLAGLQHERATDPRVGELLHGLDGSPLVADPLAPAAVNVRELRRSHERLRRLPRALVEELARTATLSEQAWEAARATSDFVAFRPWLERVLTLKRQEAECLGYVAEAYDALLEEYEPGATARNLARHFEVIEPELRALLGVLGQAPRRSDPTLLQRDFPVARQRTLCAQAASTLGFDFQRGRLDTAVHPFCTAISPGDCRITTRYRADDFGEGFFATLHEVGHGLYEQGMLAEHAGTPMGECGSVAVHESQSRLWENQVGRRRAFWTHFFPLVRRAFPTALRGVSADQFHFAVNQVAPSLNRIRADEVTYNLHILVRFELERALLAGDLPPADLPGAWNDAYRKTLGVVPSNDAEGCLQDGHWSSGMFGYFPTYALGNMFAAQLFAAANRELGELERDFARGKFDRLLGWLREHVHRHGARYSAAQLIEHATGAVPDPRPLLDELRRKYTALYGL